MKTVRIKLPDEEADALERAAADRGFESSSELVRAAIGEFLTAPTDYDAEALAHDVVEHLAEKARGEAGYTPDEARIWLQNARSA